MSIAQSVRNCLAIFNSSAAESSTLKETQRLQLSEERGRFEIWAANLAAHRPGGRRSLEYRLRDSHNLKERVLGILRDLQEELGSLTELRSESSESYSISEDEGLPPEFEYDEPHDSAEDDALEAIRGIITLLYRFSLALKKPAGHSRLREVLPTTADQTQRFYTAHVEEKFPQSSSTLAQRLGQAMAARRQYLRYREQRHSKKAAGLVEPETDDGDGTMTATSVPETYNAPVVPVNGIEDTETIYSETSFALSENDQLGIRPPPVPREGSGGLPFQCPICYDVVLCPGEQAWKRHVYEDVPPYVCTIETCSSSNQPYSSRRDWQRHESRNHGASLHCPINCSFSSEDSNVLEQHLQTTHGRVYSKNAFRSIIDSHSRPKAKDLRCPLCLKACETIAKWYRHVGHHQEQLALFCLPSHHFAETEEEVLEASEIAEPESGSISSLGIDNHSEQNHDIFEESALELQKGSRTPESFVEKHLGTVHGSGQPPMNEGIASANAGEVVPLALRPEPSDPAWSATDARLDYPNVTASSRGDRSSSGLTDLDPMGKLRGEEHKEEKDKHSEIEALKRLIEKHEEERIARDKAWIAERESEAAATKQHSMRLAEAEKAREEAVMKAKELENEIANSSPTPNKLKESIRFKDAVGRKFSFPWHICNTWKGMEDLIKQAFLHVDIIGEHVQQGHYDLTGPDGVIILPQVWDTMAQPGWEVTMHLWPMGEEKQKPLMDDSSSDPFANIGMSGDLTNTSGLIPNLPPKTARKANKSRRKEISPLAAWFAGGKIINSKKAENARGSQS